MNSWNVSPEAAALHADALVWDNHACMPLRPDDAFLPQLERCKEAGIDVVSLNVMFDAIAWPDGIHVLAFFRNWILSRPGDYVLAGTADDILRAKADGKLAVAFDIEGMTALGGQVSMVRFYYDLGVRWMLVAYNKNNACGGGCQDDDQGLTAFGRQVLDEMARVGMIVCCSHTGERTAMQVFEHAANPVILSHSNPAALQPHPRNVSDRVMRACAETGGVVGITGIGYFLQHQDISPDNFVRHIDYAVERVGPDHVALGLDYVFDEQELKDFLENHRDLFPKSAGYTGSTQMIAPEQMPAITDALLQRGYPESAIRGILGENLLRLGRQVWR